MTGVQKLVRDGHVYAALIPGDKWDKLAYNFWIKQDILPIKYSSGKKINRLKTKIESQFKDYFSFSVRVKANQEVEVLPLISSKDYEKILTPKEYKEFIKYKKMFTGHKAIFISATPQGGGVAIMRHAMIRLFNAFGLDVRWFVLSPDSRTFEITKKKFHNILQSVASDSDGISTQDENYFNQWSVANFDRLRTPITESDIIVIDDPQPSGLIPLIKKANPKAKLIYRSHIQIDTDAIEKEPRSRKTWKYLWRNIKLADVFVSHPIRSFVPKEVDQGRLVYLPPATDPIDGLNKPLSKQQENYYFQVFNKILTNNGQSKLDINRKYIVQIARFDPSKGIPDVLQSYKLFRSKIGNNNPPQLVIVGNSSIDDPDGIPIYKLIREMLKTEEYKDIKDDIKVIPLPPLDQLLNTILRRAHICLQLSHKEGFEFKITEATMKGVPVIIYNSGGMPLQVQNNRSGFIVPVGDTEKVADLMYRLNTDKKLYNRISEYAKNHVVREFLTPSLCISWLKIALGEHPAGTHKLQGAKQ